MTYSQTVKEVNKLYDILNAKTTTEIPYIGQETVCEGHGIFRETGKPYIKYQVTKHNIITGETREAILKTIDVLENSIKDEKERREKIAKTKRYKKELEKLNERKDYLEKWLNENATTN